MSRTTRIAALALSIIAYIHPPASWATDLVPVETPSAASSNQRQVIDDACATIRDLTRATRHAQEAAAELRILEGVRKQKADFNDMGLSMTFVCPKTGRQTPVNWHANKEAGNAVFDASAAIVQRDLDKAKAKAIALLKRNGLKHPSEIPDAMEAAWAELPSDSRAAYDTVAVSIVNVGQRGMGNKTRFASDAAFENTVTDAPNTESGSGTTRKSSGRTKTVGESVVENVHSTEYMTSIKNLSPLAIKGLRGELIFIDNYGEVVGRSRFETPLSIEGRTEFRLTLEVDDPVFAQVDGKTMFDKPNAVMREMQAVLLRIDLAVLEDGTKIQPGLTGIDTPQEVEVVQLVR